MTDDVTQTEWSEAVRSDDTERMQAINKGLAGNGAALSAATQPMPRRLAQRASGRRMIDVILRAVAGPLRDVIKRLERLEAEPRVRTVGHYVGGWHKEYNYSIGHTVNHSGSLWYCEVAGTTDRPGDDGPGWSAAVKRAPEGNFVPRRATFTGGELETESESLEDRIAELERETADAMRYRDVFRQGDTYEKNEVVTHKGATWIARRQTDEVPGTSNSWKMTAKGYIPPRDREKT